MTTIKQNFFYAVLFLITALGCKKNVETNVEVSEEIETAKPTPPPPTPPVHGVCDYDINDAAIIGAGWTKIFEDLFSTNLSNWNSWNGGAFNNELQLYRASNLSVTNGNLVIEARQETVSGPATPFDPTPKTFNYTS